LTKNYGVIYLGFGVGSIIGSIVASLFGGFIATFNVILVLLVVALVMSLTIRMPEPKTPVPAKKATKSTPRLVNMTAESA
jgi:OFA family oxalate/formate antiporter-like MFS transporter